MKAVVAVLFALVAVSSAQWGYPALGYSGWASPALGYSGWGSPLAYSAPVAIAAPIAPAVQSGYVAATRGAVHTAPLPQGPHAFSHHINTAPAPGTW